MRLLQALALSLALAGCAGFGGEPIPVSQSLSEPAQTAQKSINEANVTLTASYRVVAQNVSDGIWTKEQGRGYVAKLNDLSGKVDEAQGLLKSNPLEAKTKAELLSRAILALHREIAAKARK